MSFVYSDARTMVDLSTDWAIGLEASIRKWKQVVNGEKCYSRNTRCGLCMVATNRNVDCEDCPAYHICGGGYVRDDVNAESVLQMLQEIDLGER